MTDEDRLHPFTNCTEQRQVMISLYYPAQRDPSKLLEQALKADSRHNTIPFMPPLTAALYEELVVPFGFPQNTFEQHLAICQQDTLFQHGSSAYPLLIFSPGGGASRLLYSTILEDLARKAIL